MARLTIIWRYTGLQLHIVWKSLKYSLKQSKTCFGRKPLKLLSVGRWSRSPFHRSARLLQMCKKWRVAARLHSEVQERRVATLIKASSLSSFNPFKQRLPRPWIRNQVINVPENKAPLRMWISADTLKLDVCVSSASNLTRQTEHFPHGFVLSNCRGGAFETICKEEQSLQKKKRQVEDVTAIIKGDWVQLRSCTLQLGNQGIEIKAKC